MKAIRISEHGNQDVLKIVDLPEPVPKDDEVKIKIKASSLNHMDIWVRNGIPGIGELPLILGCDAAGEITEVGAETSLHKVGDRVFIFPLQSCENCKFCNTGKPNQCKDFKIYGEHIDGTHREFITLKEKYVLPLPKNLSFEEGAAFPLTFLTAWHMLMEKGELKHDEDVLIMAAASGIGVAAVQIAKIFGAKVIATASTKEKINHIKELGADEVIDHYNESISKRIKEITNKKGVELIFEHVGEKVWNDCLKSLAWSGRLVTCGATSGPKVTTDLRHIFIKQQKIIGSTMGTPKDMKEVCKLLEDGKIKPIVDKTFSFTEIKAAHEYLENSKNLGKVVITWE